MSQDGGSTVRPLTRARADLRLVLWLVAAYLVIRLFGVLLLDAGLHAPRDSPALAPDSLGEIGTEQAAPPTLGETLAKWDGGWYLKIAEHGYPDRLDLTDPRDDVTAPLVFPPLYPTMMRIVSALGLSLASAGIAVSLLAGIAAMIGVYALAREFISPRAAAITALLWASGPMTIVLSMVYSEALFVALAAWALVLARRGWWLVAGFLGLLSGLTRSTGLAVGLALVVAAVVWKSAPARESAPPEDAPPEDALPEDAPPEDAPPEDAAGPLRWKAAIGASAALLGVPLWWLYVAVVSGRLDGWFAAQSFFWGSRFDFGASVAANAWRMLTFDAFLDPTARVVNSASALAMAGACALLIVLLAELWRRRPASAAWLPLAAYAAVLVGLAVGSAGYQHSKIRFLVPMFVLLFIPAQWLERAGAKAQAFAVLGLAVVGAWTGVFMLTVWPYAI